MFFWLSCLAYSQIWLNLHVDDQPVSLHHKIGKKNKIDRLELLIPIPNCYRPMLAGFVFFSISIGLVIKIYFFSTYT